MKNERIVIGLDYGTDSCRALVINAENGQELASEVVYYSRWKDGLYCDPIKNQYRQHPLDYIESMDMAVRASLSKCPEGTGQQVVGISFDTTGSTPVLLDREGTPLALLPEYAENPNAMFVLWKDHTAIREAAEINELAKRWEIDYTAYSGGVYSSEWVWSKMTHLLRVDESVRKHAYSWAEHSDWMPALLAGKTRPETMIRSRCSAGHKAMWNEKWGGLPSMDFLTSLEPLLELFDGHLYTETHTSDTVVGTITPEWAKRLGVAESSVVTVGAIDCHMGAVGAQITDGAFVRVIGTSTCDIMVVPYEDMGDRLIAGICGQVDGSVMPGRIGLEAGQSAFGDLYAWYKRLLFWPTEQLLKNSSFLSDEQKEKVSQEIANSILPQLTAEAEKIPLEKTAPIAIDWMNGRRTPIANQAVKGTITGLTLGTSAPMIYRALVEATAFGSRAIVESMLAQGVTINSVIGIGGISLKSPFVMQTLADVLGMPIKVARVEQACALGAAMFAAVAAGVYPSIGEAQQALGHGFAFEYEPNPQRHHIYSAMYKKYLSLGVFTEKELF